MRVRFLLLGIGLLAGGCPDPVPEQIEEDQGPEVAGVPQGPLHRAGQRCLACHRDGGEGPAFSVAGTVYAREGEALGAPAVAVALRDARGEERVFLTNEVGNFWVPAMQWSPTFPLAAELRVDTRTIAMRTEIGRDGSCNTCHVGAGDARRMPGVFVEAAR